MWFKQFLAALGIIWDVLECVACGIQTLIRKGDIHPPGWVDTTSGWICDRCSVPKKHDPTDPSDLPDGKTFGV